MVVWQKNNSFFNKMIKDILGIMQLKKELYIEKGCINKRIQHIKEKSRFINKFKEKDLVILESMVK